MREGVSTLGNQDVLAKELNLVLEVRDLLVLVIQALIELADDFVCTEHNALSLLQKLISQKNDLLCKDPLNIARPV